MRWRSGIAVALVATLGVQVSCRADPHDEPESDAVAAAWAAEIGPWIGRFGELVRQVGGLAAVPFLAPDVVIDVRTIAGSDLAFEGIDEAIVFFSTRRPGPGTPSERLSYEHSYFVDATGLVVPGAYDQSARPGVSPPLPGHLVMSVEMGPLGVERLEQLPSTAFWRQESPAGSAQPAVDAERIAAAWVEAWSSDDPALIAALYAPEATLEDDIVGVEVVGAAAVRDRWELSPATTWQVIDRDGTAAVHLWSPRYGPDAGSLRVLALVRGDTGAGCPGALAVSWELDGEGRIARERRLRSVDDTRRCVAVDELPDGWWTGRTTPVDRAALGEDLRTVTARIVEDGMTVEIVNGTPVLVSVVSWALARFDLAGMRLPVVRRVTFTSYADYCDDLAGRAIVLPDTDPATGMPITGGWELVLCVDSEEVYVDEQGTEPSQRVRYVVLHEFAHAWVDQYVDPEVRDHVMVSLRLPTWSDREFDWDQRGVEWAASFVAWGLMDTPMPLFELDVPPIEQRVAGFQMLTGHEPLQRIE